MLCTIEASAQTCSQAKQAADEGEQRGYSNVVSDDRRNPNHFFMCPKFWDVKERRPRDPLRRKEFEHLIVDNKLSATEKKKTKKYILERNERNYWDNAKDDISRYKVDMWENFHPEGYLVPCCSAANAERLKKGWKVEVLEEKNGKLDWVMGTIKTVSDDKKSAYVVVQGKGKNYKRGDIRIPRVSKYITKQFPSSVGGWGHIHNTIKKLINQDISKPNDSDPLGLVRKGVKQDNKSFLHSLATMLDETPDNIIKDIIYDLRRIVNIRSIANGGFVNKFRSSHLYLSDNECNGLYKLLEERESKVIKRYHKFIGSSKGKERITILMNKADTLRYTKLKTIIDSHTSIVMFKKYISSEDDFISDSYIIPVLQEIYKNKGRTFSGSGNLSIVVFEGVLEDVIIKPPVGGFSTNSDTMLLFYKEKDRYEPIFNRVDENENQPFIKDELIISCIQNKLNEYIEHIKVSNDDIPDINELKIKLSNLDLPIKGYLYDNYNKVCHVIVNRLLVPVKPCGINELQDKKGFHILSLSKSSYPSFDDTIQLLKQIDERYLSNISVSTEGRWSDKKFTIQIKEIVLHNGQYIPVQSEPYNRKKHKNVYSLNSMLTIDNNIITDRYGDDDRIDYIVENKYKLMITELFYQKMNIIIKEDKSFYEDLRKIIDHPIRLRFDKANELLKLLQPRLSKEIVVGKGSFTDREDDYEGNKLVVYALYDISASKVVELLLKKFIQLIIIYDPSDYNRFLQVNNSVDNLRTNLKDTELLFTYADIEEELYMDYFINRSKYIRNVTLYGESITESLRLQLHKKRQKDKPMVSISKKYPNILRKLFPKGMSIVALDNSALTHYDLVFESINSLDSWTSKDKLMNLLTSLLQTKEEGDLLETYNEFVKNDYTSKEEILEAIGHKNYIISPADLHFISEAFKMGVVLVTTAFTDNLQHEIFIAIHEDTYKGADTPMVIFYQKEDYFVGVDISGNSIVPLSTLDKPMFKQELKQQYRPYYDELY